MNTLEMSPSSTLRNRRYLLGSAAAMTASLLLPGHAKAQGFPQKTIRIVVPFPAGGTTDVVARILAQRMSENLGQPVVVENRAGAGGAIGADAVAKAAPMATPC